MPFIGVVVIMMYFSYRVIQFDELNVPIIPLFILFDGIVYYRRYRFYRAKVSADSKKSRSIGSKIYASRTDVWRIINYLF